MESLEKLTERINFGHKIDNEPSKIFFSLEPSLRFALINYLSRKHGNEIPDKLIHFADLEVIKIFDEIVEISDTTRNQIFELYQVIVDYRLITFSRKHGFNNPTIVAKSENLKSFDYYLNMMESVVSKLLWDLNNRPVALS